MTTEVIIKKSNTKGKKYDAVINENKKKKCHLVLLGIVILQNIKMKKERIDIYI